MTGERGFTYEEDMAAFKRDERRIDLRFFGVPLACMGLFALGCFFLWLARS